MIIIISQFQYFHNACMMTTKTVIIGNNSHLSHAFMFIILRKLLEILFQNYFRLSNIADIQILVRWLQNCCLLNTS